MPLHRIASLVAPTAYSHCDVRTHECDHYQRAYYVRHVGETTELSAGFPNDGLKGIVAKDRGSRYRSERCREWIKIKNPAHPAIGRAMLIALSKRVWR